MAAYCDGICADSRSSGVAGTAVSPVTLFETARVRGRCVHGGGAAEQWLQWEQPGHGGKSSVRKDMLAGVVFLESPSGIQCRLSLWWHMVGRSGGAFVFWRCLEQVLVTAEDLSRRQPATRVLDFAARHHAVSWSCGSGHRGFFLCTLVEAPVAYLTQGVS